MTRPLLCTFCNNNIPQSAERCPHCARPGLFANVRAAEDPEEVAALESRYDLAKTDAMARGADTALGGFENVAAGSGAVIARSANEMQRLASSDNEIYATYYELIGSGTKSHTDDEWSALRAVADAALFPGYYKHIRFAALSLNATGLSHWGECSMQLREDMIAHRATVFEENSVMFMQHQDIKMGDAYNLPRGYKASWADRSKLCVAKLAKVIDATTSAGEYSEILLREGATRAEDDFVEVHVWGPMTRRTLERVTITGRPKRWQRHIIKAIKEKLKAVSVPVQVK